MKALLTSVQLVEHMKNKGIRFTITPERDAQIFLEKNNYYMKLAAYRLNYHKFPEGKNAGKYIELEFAYLQELSRLDMQLRYLILEMCLDIEHSLKVALLNAIENNPKEDGYNIIRKFIMKFPKVCDKIRLQKTSAYSEQLVDKHYPYFSAWVFVELISFGDLTNLCNFYCLEYGKELANNKLLNSVRDIRNASAHSNCLLNKLCKGETLPDVAITEFVKTVSGIGEMARRNRLSNRFIYDFTTMLFIYDKTIASKGIKTARYAELKEFIDNRLFSHIDYFTGNDVIYGAFNFLKKVVDKVALIE